MNSLNKDLISYINFLVTQNFENDEDLCNEYKLNTFVSKICSVDVIKMIDSKNQTNEYTFDPYLPRLQSLLPYLPYLPYLPEKIKVYKLFYFFVQRHGQNLQHVPLEMMDDELIIHSFIRSGCNLLKLVPPEKQSLKVILYALEHSGPHIIEHVVNKSDELYESLIKIRPDTIVFIENPSESICHKAIKINPNVLRYIDKQTILMCLESMTHDYEIDVYEWVKICSNPNRETTLNNLLNMKKIEENKYLLKKKLNSL